MEGNKWYQNTEKEIGSLKEKMPKRDYSAYELDTLLSIAKRVSSLSDKCEECAESKEKITNAISGIAGYPNISKKQKKNYIHTFRITAIHLKESHSIKIVKSPGKSRARIMQGHKRGLLEFAAFIVGILGLTGLTVGYLVVAFGYSSVLMGFFAALTITGFILAQQWRVRITGSLLMITVGALGFGTLSFVPEISKEMLGGIGVAILIIIPAMVYILSGILYLVIGSKESGSWD